MVPDTGSEVGPGHHPPPLILPKILNLLPFIVFVKGTVDEIVDIFRGTKRLN